MNNTLTELGLKKGWVYEVLVTTKGGGDVNAAPMGIKTGDMKHITLEVYKSSRTCENLFQTQECIINFTDDITLFHEALKSEKKFNYVTSEKAYLKLKVVETIDDEDKIKFNMNVIESNISGAINLVNRGKNLALECLIKSTKPGASKKDLAEHYRIIKKVAPKSVYEKIVGEIMEDLG